MHVPLCAAVAGLRGALYQREGRGASWCTSCIGCEGVSRESQAKNKKSTVALQSARAGAAMCAGISVIVSWSGKLEGGFCNDTTLPKISESGLSRFRIECEYVAEFVRSSRGPDF